MVAAAIAPDDFNICDIVAEFKVVRPSRKVQSLRSLISGASGHCPECCIYAPTLNIGAVY
jgi:hypothetical protein